MITIPGLIDTHVHLREPGATQKEDFESGTKAAIAGGYTCVLDMPNNPEPTTTPEALDKKMALTQSVTLNSFQGLKMPKQVRHDNNQSRIYSDVGFHFGATADSIQYFNQVKNKVFGLKVYMNHTTGTLLQEDPQVLQAIFESWPKEKVLMVHAEGETLRRAIQLAKENGNRLHICHVSQAAEVEIIKQAKSDGLPVTCEVTCHHLFLTVEDQKRLGPYGIMRPPLATKEDQQALWKGIKEGTVDIIASDHAPHTKKEKLTIEKTPNGVPGLETTLPLLLTAVSEGRLTLDDVIRLCHTNPAKIFNIPTQLDTFVEAEITKPYTLNPKTFFTKCGWSPFSGMRVKGRVKRVFIRGEKVFEDGQILTKPGSGRIIQPVS